MTTVADQCLKLDIPSPTSYLSAEWQSGGAAEKRNGDWLLALSKSAQHSTQHAAVARKCGGKREEGVKVISCSSDM